MGDVKVGKDGEPRSPSVGCLEYVPTGWFFKISRDPWARVEAGEVRPVVAAGGGRGGGRPERGEGGSGLARGLLAGFQLNGWTPSRGSWGVGSPFLAQPFGGDTLKRSKDRRVQTQTDSQRPDPGGSSRRKVHVILSTYKHINKQTNEPPSQINRFLVDMCHCARARGSF